MSFTALVPSDALSAGLAHVTNAGLAHVTKVNVFVVETAAKCFSRQSFLQMFGVHSLPFVLPFS
jgi:hypothetical protein